MSFLQIKSFLVGAFARIDRTHELAQRKNTQTAQNVFASLFPGEDVEYRNGVVVIFSSSSTLKQKIFLKKEKIINECRRVIPEIVIDDLVFKGPRR